MCCSHTCQSSVIAALPPPFLLLSFPFTHPSFLSPFPSLPFPCTPPPSVFPMHCLPIDSYCICPSLFIIPPLSPPSLTCYFTIWWKVPIACVVVSLELQTYSFPF